LFFKDSAQERTHRTDVFLEVFRTQTCHMVREAAAKCVRSLLDPQEYSGTDVIDAADGVLPIRSEIVVDDKPTIGPAHENRLA